MPGFGIAESREMDPASRRTFGKLKKYVDRVLAIGGFDPSDPTYSGSVALGRRNLLHNGQMAVIQRGLGTYAGITATSQIAADRWTMSNSNVGAFDFAATTYGGFGVNIPTGQPVPANIVRFQCATADVTPAAADNLVCFQAIEAKNLQHLKWGTSEARPLTLSFDCFSSVAGTFVVDLSHGTSARTSSRSFTVPASSTTHVVLKFDGNTADAIPDSTGVGLYCEFFLCAGSNYTGGAALGTAWNSVTNTRAVGLTNTPSQTIGNTWLVTNVQLEVGTVATPYEVRPYNIELFDCQRYFQLHAYMKMVGVSAAALNPSIVRMGAMLPVEMRASPAVTITNGPVNVYDGVSVSTFASIATNYSTNKVLEFDSSATTLPVSAAQRAVISFISGSWAINLSAEI